MRSKILKFARCVQIFVLFGHSRSSCQRKKQYICKPVNSKFKKIARKFKQIWNFLASKRLGSASCVQIFIVFGHWRGFWRKTKFGSGKNLGKMTILFFLARAPRMSFDHKNLHAPCAPKPLWCQKIHICLNFFAILFQIYCSQEYRLTVFPRHKLLECSNSTKICTHLAHMSIFYLTKI